jgi:glutathione transport system substrate-binding protein
VMLNTGWSSSTGDADWGSRPMLYTKSFPPVLSNLAWYSNKDVDAAIEAGLATVDPPKRAAAYAKEQEVAWKDAPWIYLATSHNLAAYSANLTGVTIRPDAQVNLDDDADMK